MRRLHAMLGFAAIALMAALAGTPGPARGQEMHFRPLPAESLAVSGSAHGTINGSLVEVHTTGHQGKPGVKVVVGRDGSTQVSLPGGQVVSDSESSDESDAPTPPTPPAPPGDRETTGEIVRFGSDIDVPYGQVVSGDVVSMGGSVRVKGTVRGSVTSMGGDVTLDPTARVDGDVVCFGGTLHEAPGSSVGGQRVTAPRVPGGRLLLPALSVLGTGARVAGHIAWMLFWFVLAFLFVKLAPGRTQAALDMSREEPGMSFLIGLLLWGLLIPSVVALALAIVLLCITLIGIPVAIAVAFGYTLLLVLIWVWGAVVGFLLVGGLLHQRLQGSTSDLVRAAGWGVGGVYLVLILGDLFHIVPLFGFVGGFMKVIARSVMLALGTLGAGAIVRGEYQRRTVQTWWNRSRPRRRNGGDDFPPPPAPHAPPAPPQPGVHPVEPFVPPPPAPPSPPEAFAPPPAPPEAFQPPPPSPSQDPPPIV